MSSNLTPLDASQLYTPCDTSALSFQSTNDIDEVLQVIGQDQALDAIKFGVGIAHEGYNIFVLGAPGSGKFSTVLSLLTSKAKSLAKPNDWCYVYNFDQPHKPKVISLNHAQGTVFSRDMSQLVDELRHIIPAMFSSDDYQAQVHTLEQALKDREADAIDVLRQEASEKSIALIRTAAGFAFASLHEGEVIKPQDYDNLPEETRKTIDTTIDELQVKLHKIVHQIPLWQNETRAKLKELNRQQAMETLRFPIDHLKRSYSGNQAVIAYLERLQQDVVDNIETFVDVSDDALLNKNTVNFDMGQSSPFYRYQVNLLANNEPSDGAAVVYEDHPTYQNLVGRIEHVALMGALLTDYRLIKPGALHRANQGFLILDAHKILSHPYAWDGLKRALQSKEIRIQSLEQMLSLASTVSLEPESIPLNTKVVLLGDRYLYYLLYQMDPEFCELFKVAADFDETVARIPESTHQYISLIAALARRHGLRGFLPAGVGRVIEQCSRSAEDAEKLSTHLREITDLLREADYWAGECGRQFVGKEDVEKALTAREQRSGRVKALQLESIQRKTHLIDTDGSRVGVVNGLSIIFFGDVEFGTPTRITATVRMGEGEVVNIDREVELSGPIHSKGVFILASYLSTHYAQNYPFSLAANIAFEQSYGMIDGDSASSAELFALLSALARLPLKQSIAVTGSVNQLGEVQPIGGVNYKIEGFFDTCKARGLSGEQGVLIPYSNIKDLMLRSDVVEAAKQQQFHIYAMRTIDEGIAVLTGMSAGARDENDCFPEDSVNYRVEQRLIDMAIKRQDFSAATRDDETESE